MRRMDVNELYDQVKGHAGQYVLCCDLIQLSLINEKGGMAAGDAVIREAVARMEAILAPGDLLLHLGGDEYALLTNLRDGKTALALATRLTLRNGQPVAHEGVDYPVGLTVGVLRLPEKYEDFESLQDAMQESVQRARQMQRRCFLVE